MQELGLHPLDNRADDKLFSLSHRAFREWVSLDIVFGYLHDSDPHLEVVLDHFQEDFNRDLLLQGRTYQLEEVLQLLLLVLSSLSGDQVHSNVSFGIRLQL